MTPESKGKYPFNQIQLGRDNLQGAMTQGYGSGNADPHQSGYMGETLSNTQMTGQKKRGPKASFHNKYGN